jgi:hypothetical protein
VFAKLNIQTTVLTGKIVGVQHGAPTYFGKEAKTVTVT